MATLDISNSDYGSVEIEKGSFAHDKLLVFAGIATVLKGTLLAVKEVADAITATADVGNTGNGTFTLASVVAGAEVPLAGSYNLECIEVVAHGGIFKLVDPNGVIVASYLAMNTLTGAAAIFKVAGMTVTVTDGSTDFIVGDKCALVVAADGKLYPYAIAGLGGTQIPTHVMLYAVTSTGAGNVVVTPMRTGKIKRERIVIDADGDASNLTDAIVLQLRIAGIIAEKTAQISQLDNQ